MTVDQEAQRGTSRLRRDRFTRSMIVNEEQPAEKAQTSVKAEATVRAQTSVKEQPVVKAETTVKVRSAADVPETVEIPSGGWDVSTLRSILAVPKTKDSVPTLTCIDKGVYKRFFLIDVDGDAYRRAWEYYKTVRPNSDPDEFIIIVQRILESGMPRMYRAVSYVPLI